jgi:O-antigen ligase
MFCLEGLFRTRLLPAVILAAVLAAFVVVPFAGKLPHPIQRSLSFLPIHLDNEDANSARAITHWRVVVWKNLWSQVPHHLVLGKGLGTDAHAREKWAYGINQVSDMAALADVLGDVHNGPISLLLPFGLPGVIGFVWFLVAGGRVLYRNYKLGDPAFAQINRCLYALFITKTVMFLFIFGAFYSDLACFVGFVGLSIALNGGARNPAGEPAAPRSILLNNLKLASG